VKIKCHGLQATALLRVPKGSSGQSGAAVKAAAPSPRAQIHAPTPRSPPPGKPAFVPVTASPHAPTPYVQGVGERCARNDGKTWRCKMTAIEGASYCAHHRQRGNASPGGGGRTGKVLKERRSPRERGRMGSSLTALPPRPLAGKRGGRAFDVNSREVHAVTANDKTPVEDAERVDWDGGWGGFDGDGDGGEVPKSVKKTKTGCMHYEVTRTRPPAPDWSAPSNQQQQQQRPPPPPTPLDDVEDDKERWESVFARPAPAIAYDGDDDDEGVGGGGGGGGSAAPGVVNEEKNDAGTDVTIPTIPTIPTSTALITPLAKSTLPHALRMLTSHLGAGPSAASEEEILRHNFTTGGAKSSSRSNREKKARKLTPTKSPKKKKATTTTTTTPAAVVVAAAASKKKEEESGAFYTLVPIRPRRRGERRSLRTFPGASLRPTLGFNTHPQRLSTPSDAFQLHPDVRLYRTALRVRETDRRHDREDVIVGERVEARAREETQARQAPRGEGSERSEGSRRDG